jgi:hypothetical protein
MATNAGSDACKSAATPAADASAQSAWPADTPSAVKSAARRPPSSAFRIVSAVSWPGVTITSAEIPRNAAACAITFVL